MTVVRSWIADMTRIFGVWLIESLSSSSHVPNTAWWRYPLLPLWHKSQRCPNTWSIAPKPGGHLCEADIDTRRAMPVSAHNSSSLENYMLHE